VATGDITTANNIAAYGAIYTPGNWNRGKISLTGLAYAGGISPSNNGQSTMVQTSAPWFDPRAGSTGGGTTKTIYANFTEISP
jgi:hypothetical protein